MEVSNKLKITCGLFFERIIGKIRRERRFFVKVTNYIDSIFTEPYNNGENERLRLGDFYENLNRLLR